MFYRTIEVVVKWVAPFRHHQHLHREQKEMIVVPKSNQSETAREE